MNSHKRRLLALTVILTELKDDEMFYANAKRHKKDHTGREGPDAHSKQLLADRLNAGPNDYRNLLRVSREQFLHLLSRVRAGIQKDKSSTHRHISAQTRLQVTLRYLASGELPQSLGEQFKLGCADVGALIQKTCTVIYKELKDDFMRAPKTEEDWKEVMRVFKDKCNFPNCVGALSGRHVVIKKPSKSSGMYMNSKKTFSLILLAVVDANCKFIYIDVGAKGAQEANEVWQATPLHKALSSNKARLPEVVKVASSPDILLPPVFVTDDPLPLERHVMKPFGGTNLTQDKRMFNDRLSRARQVVDDAFGTMENRFGCLRNVIQERPERAAAIIYATCVLHNFLGNSVPSPPGASAEASCGSSTFFGFPLSCGDTSSDGAAIRDDLTVFFNR
ncbi:hypothetical protein HPB49_013351 [Dermacentor silvarum]|uniref:Uncharacterized protein n=1 Tax=Dermacentor silvarum TaxID=543639 RepID=A0ACB8DPI2_DERSI|nr:uncharacterized protein LOC119466430 [Dermacentor silvarum]KAH7974258.1 hypothetical protein HPB49_013351 [Dermacentor silvarum]